MIGNYFISVDLKTGVSQPTLSPLLFQNPILSSGQRAVAILNTPSPTKNQLSSKVQGIRAD